MELKLKDENNKLWKVQRVFSSELLFQNENNKSGRKRKNINKIFSFLTSVGLREGTYIVW